MQQQVKVTISMLVSDDTGQLVQFLAALTVLVKVLYSLFNLLHSSILHVQKFSRVSQQVMRFSFFSACYVPG